jgi:hypothetical protein
VASTVSGVTILAALTASTPGGMQNIAGSTQQKGAWIANLNPDPSLLNLFDANIKIKDLMGNDAPPLLDNGSQICLSFLIHQGCWSTCYRANKHNHKLTPAERLK